MKLLTDAGEERRPGYGSGTAVRLYLPLLLYENRASGDRILSEDTLISGNRMEEAEKIQRPHRTEGNSGTGEDALLSSLLLGQALERLDEEEREIIFLRYVNELSAAQIGAVLGISRFAVHRRLKRGLERLRQWIRKEDFQ